MKEIFLEKTTEIKKNLKKLQERLNVKLFLKGKKLAISGAALKEYDAERVIDAINFGFSAEKALALKEEDIVFRKIHIRDFTRRPNLKDVKARLIGTKGKTKKTIEEISDTEIIIQGNEIGIIGSAESIENAVTAITNIIKGSKQTNVYKYLEKANTRNKDEGLGLKY